MDEENRSWFRAFLPKTPQTHAEYDGLPHHPQAPFEKNSRRPSERTAEVKRVSDPLTRWKRQRDPAAHGAEGSGGAWGDLP